MEEILITQKSQDDSVSPVDDNQSETVEKKQTELLEQKRLEESSQAEPEITRDQLSLSKQLLNWRTLVPLIIVIVAVIFFVQKLHIDPQKTWAAIRSANFIFLLAAFVVYYLSFAIRAARWRILLENVGFTKANGVELPKFWKLTEIIYISWFVNSIVPAKLGDLYRAYLLRQESGVSATRTFGTIMAERLLNLIAGDPLHVITAACFIALGEALLTVVPLTGGGVGLVEAGMLAMIALFNQGTANALNVTTAAILLDRTISYSSVIVFGFIVFMFAFGRQATKRAKNLDTKQE